MGNVLCCTSRSEEYEARDIVFLGKVGHGKGSLSLDSGDNIKGFRGVQQNGPCALDSKAIPSELIGNILDHENGPAKGLAYQVHYLGPPTPPCEEGRVATMKAINKIDLPEDPEIVSILKLTTSMFRAPVALVALFDQKRVFVSDQTGDVINRGDFPWRWTLCAWSLAYNNPQILVIPDTKQDARFAENAKVIGSPFVRFYAGAPLIASNGHRLGTLCFADVVPRPGFDAGSCCVMNNLSELVVRHLEKDVAIKVKLKSNEQLQSTYGHLQRTLDCFEHTLVLLDTSVDGWAIMHINAAWSKLTGIDRQEVQGLTLHDVFDGFDGLSIPNKETNKAASSNLEFQLTMATIKLYGGSGRRFTLSFRPASKEGMDLHVVPIGIPSFLAPEAAPDSLSARRFYFMAVEPISTAMSMSSSSNLSSSLNSFKAFSTVEEEEVISGLKLGHLLGKGSFGSVYYGTWMGTPVAVKVIDNEAQQQTLSHSTMLEAILGKELRHPNVVTTHRYVIKRTPAYQGNTSSSFAAHSGSQVMDTMRDSKSGHERSKKSQMPQLQYADPAAALDSGQSEEPCWPVIEWRTRDHWDGHAKAVAAPSFDRVSQDHKRSGGQQLSDARRGSLDQGPTQVWIMLEYCDRGCLQEAIDRGWLRMERSCLSGTANIEAVVATAHEIAGALAYLHSHNIVHGDLSSWNVMLCSSGSAASRGNRGFIAKIADFGLARSLNVKSKIQTKQYGTLTHMPPETLTDGIISKAVDVYSYGVLLWQMFTGSRPWAGLTHAQIVMTVGQQFQQLQYPEDTPEPYVALTRACMHRDAEARPTFDRVQQMLDEMMIPQA